MSFLVVVKANGSMVGLVGLFAHPLAQQALFQGSTFLRIATFVVGDAIRRDGLALSGPVGAAILSHRPDAADLVFQQGQT
jgi:hypothetical protein